MNPSTFHNGNIFFLYMVHLYIIFYVLQFNNFWQFFRFQKSISFLKYRNFYRTFFGKKKSLLLEVRLTSPTKIVKFNLCHSYFEFKSNVLKEYSYRDRKLEIITRKVVYKLLRCLVYYGNYFKICSLLPSTTNFEGFFFYNRDFSDGLQKMETWRSDSIIGQMKKLTWLG